MTKDKVIKDGDVYHLEFLGDMCDHKITLDLSEEAIRRGPLLLPCKSYGGDAKCDARYLVKVEKDSGDDYHMTQRYVPPGLLVSKINATHY
jgi:hypothetical protein